ncbi:DUF1905 domain-containing protein [Parerythrobacter jejuensis]|uniref:DUF1905 domain-containing protein n=1 Tax=Parerythrobacter jejuensis TaxID=795812 RepID=A0A845AN26_9SPHN|nr:DUF1905 domain-containing protein [Parerythrobacter jejuensis]MXP30261.1 DUF1905 domain-containing protein [Parerythrobacter jejuensis]MXP33021.1 DUF1905 domain-containing protein [Parerythrobacter jejuensis]
MSDILTHAGPLWRWTATNGVSWHFISIDGDAGEEMSGIEAMRRLELGRKRGFRSVKVKARIGETEWSTSCFPSDDGGWLLPIKAPVRKAESIAEGDEVSVRLELV